ncbi:nuclear cap-binding protein subunit 3 isoform X3 [Octopus bimaculoides]|uniref:nuclear cap-binding protein subunit 3 isoform X3 n=1 Tax=Octopus bimaculoides TaxID=37653 RepID=UPI0022E7177D|nr:nuclear cap-binding protein subunit 3 isoform X3 [Octopus bimaculoides]
MFLLMKNTLEFDNYEMFYYDVIIVIFSSQNPRPCLFDIVNTVVDTNFGVIEIVLFIKFDTGSIYFTADHYEAGISMNRNRQLYRALTMAEGSKQKLPNLKICIDNNEGSDNEEIIFTDKDDYSFIDEPYSHRVEFSVRLNENNEAKKFERKKYENKDGNFVTGIDITKKEEEEKREERARRFGLEGNNYHVSLAALYASLGIREEDLHKDERGIRLETVHVRGVQDMSTKDVFHYFQEFAPSTVEWIEDSSCNVVWSDAMTAARALNKLSRSRDVVNSWTNTNENSAAKSPTADEENQLKPDTQFDQKEISETSEKESNATKMNVDEDSNMSAISSVSHSESTCENDSDRQMESKRRPSDSKDSEDAETRETTPQPIDAKSEGELSSSEDNVELEKNYRRKLSSRLLENVPAAVDPWNSADDIPWPPGKWRLGVPTSKTSQHIFMRYATKADRKLPGAEKRSQYYVRHGNPNYGGMKGLISKSRKRRIRSVKDEIPNENIKDNLNNLTASDRVELSDWSSRHLHDDLASSVQAAAAAATTTAAAPPPAKHRMMRMYADDVEAELKAKRSGHSRVSHRIGSGSLSHRIGSGGHGIQNWVGSLSGSSSSKPVKDARQLLSRSDNVGMNLPNTPAKFHGHSIKFHSEWRVSFVHGARPLFYSTKVRWNLLSLIFYGRMLFLLVTLTSYRASSYSPRAKHFFLTGNKQHCLYERDAHLHDVKTKGKHTHTHTHTLTCSLSLTHTSIK